MTLVELPLVGTSPSVVHNHRLTPWDSLYPDFCDATSDPVLRQIALKFCAKYLSKLHLMHFDSDVDIFRRLSLPDGRDLWFIDKSFKIAQIPKSHPDTRLKFPLKANAVL